MMAYIQLRLNNIFFSAVLSLLAVSCSNEAEPQLQIPDPDEGRETSVVDISISLGVTWDIDDDGTRAAPPVISNTVDNSQSYLDINEVDKVRVVAFRRKDSDNGEFYYDKKNDMILPVEKKQEKGNDTHSDHDHRIAKGSLTKTYGYEYRVIAIAYPANTTNTFSNLLGVEVPEDINSLMSITGDTYSSFCAKLMPYGCSGWNDYLPGGTSANENHINDSILHTPQIFYGILHSENNDSDIIPYAYVDKDGNMDSKVGLTGILKRGVAKVIVEFVHTNNNYNYLLGGINYGDIKWITILAETPNTKVGLTSYDDFLNPSDPIDIKCDGVLTKKENKYTAVAYIPVSSSIQSDTISVSFYILACKTKLAIRVKTAVTDYYGYNTTQYHRNGQLTGDGFEMDVNNGTGIVCPDLIDDVFYFRRNHIYTIIVNSPYDIVKNHPLN